MIRILSDLHFAHPASLIQDVAQIEPLLEGVRTLVFNGDTVELRLKEARAPSLQSLDRLQNLCHERGIEPFVINGNHDPDASDRDHLDLMDGRVLVTHGHALFPEITPWGRGARLFRQNRLRALQEICPSGEVRLEDRLLAVRQACLNTMPGRGKMPATAMQWTRAVFSEMCHPLRPLQVLRAWLTCPDLAAAFLAQNRPEARCVVIGHTHFPGFWMRGETLVINTGAYFPWFGRRIVDILDHSLVVRAVEFEKNRFRPGRELFRWAPGPVESALPAQRLVQSVSPRED